MPLLNLPSTKIIGPVLEDLYSIPLPADLVGVLRLLSRLPSKLVLDEKKTFLFIN